MSYDKGHYGHDEYEFLPGQLYASNVYNHLMFPWDNLASICELRILFGFKIPTRKERRSIKQSNKQSKKEST